MFEVRSKFYYLNYFTTSRLLILEKHLGQLANDRESVLANFVYGLLECIKPNINVKDVRTAMQRACSTPSKRQQIGRAGLRGLGRGLLSGGALLLSQASFGGNESLSTFGRDARFGGGSPGDDLGFGGGELDTKLEPLANFEAPVGWNEPKPERESCDFPTFNADNRSYLTLEKLGQFLQSLAKNAPRLPLRPFPWDKLEHGSPNLLVVPQAELIPAVLQLYMTEPSLPLPSAEEVLLCSSKTTLETVLCFGDAPLKIQVKVVCFALLEPIARATKSAGKHLMSF